MVTSAGILLFRAADGLEARGAAAAPRTSPGPGPRQLDVFVAHMGGPFWRRRERSWSIPKGELGTLPDGTVEDALSAARREFAEEIGVPAPEVDYRELGTFRQASGKRVVVFAGESDLVVADVRSNTFEVELPRGSGRMVAFPEVDDARWVSIDAARTMLVAGQVAAIDALAELGRREG
ncbi:NUDIX domain-containing protein [Curtobacterium sp. RRHDQ10]|uniref:NUDIX domain-containing protein n=1 Tax=Curtobacterium phyllosphaerae TaxID=3413379 RepID=UPI003BF1946F